MMKNIFILKVYAEIVKIEVIKIKSLFLFFGGLR